MEDEARLRHKRELERFIDHFDDLNRESIGNMHASRPAPSVGSGPESVAWAEARRESAIELSRLDEALRRQESARANALILSPRHPRR